MKQIIIILAMLVPCTMQAQSGLLEKIKNRAKAKAEQRIVNRADKEIDKGLDEIEGKGGKIQATHQRRLAAHCEDPCIVIN